MNTIALTEQDLEANIDDRFLARGRAYETEGRVLEWHGESHGPTMTVTGTVRGSGRRPYEVFVRMGPDPGGELEIDGDCSCPVGYNCKHVAAVLFALLNSAPSAAAGADIGGGMDEAIEFWLTRLALAGRDVAETDSDTGYPASAREHLLYLLDLPAPDGRAGPGAIPKLVVTPVVCRPLKRGGYGKPTVFEMERIWGPYPPACILPTDRRLLREMASTPHYPTRRLELQGETGAELLQAMLGSGRCFWQDKDRAPLALGDPRPAGIEWALGEDGYQRLVFVTDEPTSEILPLAPPWYLDADRTCCGPLQLTLPPAVGEVLCRAPALDPEAARALAPRLELLSSRVALPRPRVLRVTEATVDTPVPLLTLSRTAVARRSFGEDTIETACARLAFGYGGHPVAWDDPQAERAGPWRRRPAQDTARTCAGAGGNRPPRGGRAARAERADRTRECGGWPAMVPARPGQRRRCLGRVPARCTPAAARCRLAGHGRGRFPLAGGRPDRVGRRAPRATGRGLVRTLTARAVGGRARAAAAAVGAVAGGSPRRPGRLRSPCRDG
jgi:hypothetical protein